LNLKTII